MKTNERILQAALNLFNRQGAANVTVRHIAAEMDISHGNLCYHYPNTDAIVFELYKELVAGLDSLVSDASAKEIDVTRLLEINDRSFHLLAKYRFIFHDFAYVMRSNAELRNHYRELSRLRKAQITAILNLLVANGYVKKEPLENHFRNIGEMYMVLVNFWMTEAEIVMRGSLKQQMQYFIPVIQSFLVPYLTEKGLKQYIDHHKKSINGKT